MERTLLQLAILFYVLELLALFLPSRRAREPRLPLLFFIGFHCNAVAFAHRWHVAGYPPFSNLHEVMLLLTSFGLPVYLFYRDRAGANLFLRGVICFLSAIFLVHPAFISDGIARPLMPALQSGWFIPHVATYMIAYFMLATSGMLALRVLAGGPAGHLAVAHRIARHAFFFLTFGLISGAAWAQEAWGTYWGWDPKEVWSLITWLVYLAYFHYRARPGAGRRMQAALLALGFAAVLVTFFIVNLAKIFKGLHSYA